MYIKKIFEVLNSDQSHEQLVVELDEESNVLKLLWTKEIKKGIKVIVLI